jgi:hypothetical protein
MALEDAVKIADGTVSAYIAKAVTTSDSADIFHTRGLYVGAIGDVKVTMVSGDVVTFVGVPNGTVLPIQVTRVWAAGTTAASMIALY